MKVKIGRLGQVLLGLGQSDPRVARKVLGDDGFRDLCNPLARNTIFVET